VFLGAIDGKWPAEKWFKAFAGTDMDELSWLNFPGEFGRIQGKTEKAGAKFIVRYDAVDVLKLLHNLYAMRTARKALLNADISYKKMYFCRPE
jgi:hypothetical protein